jgi:acetyltransferase
MEECAQKKIKGAVIISAGFSELGAEGVNLQKEIIEIARNANIKVIGPNCLGIMRPASNLNATFGPCMSPDGTVAFFSQSGALVDSVIDWALEENYGFSTIVSFGNQADLDVADFIEWAGEDKKTRAIAIYLEGIKDGKKFMRICKEVSKKKPIIALKAGRTDAGSKAISSHTGSLAGSYEIYKAAFRQSGVIVAEEVEELFDLALALSSQSAANGNGIAIITNGGGAGVLCADSCELMGVKLTPLSADTIKKLDDSGKMHPAYSRRNPLDLVGDALLERYEVALNALMEQPDIYGIIVIQTLQTMTSPILDAKAVISARQKFPKKPIICNYMGGKFSKEGIVYLQSNDIPHFNVPFKSARAMNALIQRGEYLREQI